MIRDIAYRRWGLGQEPKLTGNQPLRERFANRVDDCVRKYPGILDLGELFFEHVSEHGGHPRRGRGSLPNSQSPARPSVPKIVLLYSHYVRSATQSGALKRAKTIPLPEKSRSI